MRNKNLLLALVMGALLSGCAMKTDQTPMSFGTGAGMTTNTVTLKEAQTKVPFVILFPHVVPDGLTLGTIWISSGASVILNPTGNSVVMNYTGKKKAMILIEQQGTMGHLDDSSEQFSNVKINDYDGEFSFNTKTSQALLLWKKGNVVCMLTFIDQGLTKDSEQTLIAIASQVK